MLFLKTILKILLILAMVFLMALPFIVEFYTFRRDKDKKITYKRFRIVVYTAVYILAVTIALYLLKEFILWLETLSFIQWIVNKIALSHRTVYFAKVLVAILVNIAIGFVYGIFCKFVRIGLKKKNLVDPKKKNGEFNWRQAAERKIISFFHTETWFLVGNIVKFLSIALSAVYALVFIAYQLPAMFGAAWIPYGFISMLFSAGYIYPTISLLALWEIYFFLEGIKRLEDECPELIFKGTLNLNKNTVDLNKIADKVREEFRDFYVCDLKVSNENQEAVLLADYGSVTKHIAKAVNNDKRNPQPMKNVYLKCLDRIVNSDKGILINGSFFSEFSMYFLRYLSAIIARGDNILFVCNSDSQIDEVYDYLNQGLSEISSLYCKGFQSEAVDFDDPIWRIINVRSDYGSVDDAMVDDNNVLVTSLNFLCSAKFEANHGRFVSLIDSVIFVDALETVNLFNRQLAVINTRLQHITKQNTVNAQNSSENDMFRVRYASRKVRYICFGDSRNSGLDKVLKNLLAVEFDSVDAMKYNSATIVRCYNYEGKDGKSYLNTEENITVAMNVALLCLAEQASSVTIFTDDMIPYENIAETIAANMGQISIKADGNKIRLNKSFYNPDNYSVIIAMDSGDDLPSALRKYISKVSDEPTLIIVFSRPYMLRDFYTKNLDNVWKKSQLGRIPVEEGRKKDIARKIFVKANAGGISKSEVFGLVSSLTEFDEYVKNQDINAILRSFLEMYDIPQEDRIDLFKYFEYTSSQLFDEKGNYSSDMKLVLRRDGKLFDLINGSDMVVMRVINSAKVVLPVPRRRLSQNYIKEQNLIYNGKIYHIDKIDTEVGEIYTHLAVSGENNEVYQYLQDREYHVELDAEHVESVFPTKHVLFKRAEDCVSVSDIYVSVFRAPMEVVTNGYFEIDSANLARNCCNNKYVVINDPGNDLLAKQTYRRYGAVSAPTYSSDSVMKVTNLVSAENGALMMSIRICGKFGENVNKTMALAAAMLNEILRSMFPSVADSIAVCPVLHEEFSQEEAKDILKLQPKIKISGESDLVSDTDFNLLIIEDCAMDLGVVSVLMSAGDDVLDTLFAPIFEYLDWYFNAKEKSEYLYYGLDHEPVCFDFKALHNLSKILGGNKLKLQFKDLETIVEYETCDFCGKRYAKGDDVAVLDDGRKMCKDCASSLVANDKKVLKEHLERAKIFLESTYGITLDEDYEFCFESTVKIVNALKKTRDIVKSSSNVPLKSYIDNDKKVHVEYTIPSVNLSELLVRELTHVWQLNNAPNAEEFESEGLMAIVSVQYLRFLNRNALASVRTTYYESTDNISGVGYRALAKALLDNPQFHNNPFRYLLEKDGGRSDDIIKPPTPGLIDSSDFGAPYTPVKPDRVLDGSLKSFFYERLTDKHKKAYDLMSEAIRNHKTEIVMEGYTFDDISDVSAAIKYDHPELFWYTTYAMAGSAVTLYYGASAEEAAQLQKRIDEAVSKYLEGIDDSMSAYDVAVRIHAKIISAVDYDTIALNKQEKEGGPSKDKIDYLRTICGVFLDGKAVCAGYARGMQYLLQKCGIECAYVVGVTHDDAGRKGELHAWNILKIDGDYYYLDATWDDSSNTVQTVKNCDMGFDYFCVTTDEMSRTRNFDSRPAPLPMCTAVRANYFTHNGYVLDSYDLNRIKEIALEAVKAKRKSFVFKFSTKNAFDEALSKLFDKNHDCHEVMKAVKKADNQVLTDTVRYTHNKQIRTITVKLKYK